MTDETITMVALHPVLREPFEQWLAGRGLQLGKIPTEDVWIVAPRDWEDPTTVAVDLVNAFTLEERLDRLRSVHAELEALADNPQYLAGMRHAMRILGMPEGKRT
jgi:hypothetical protein